MHQYRGHLFKDALLIERDRREKKIKRSSPSANRTWDLGIHSPMQYHVSYHHGPEIFIVKIWLRSKLSTQLSVVSHQTTSSRQRRSARQFIFRTKHFVSSCFRFYFVSKKKRFCFNFILLLKPKILTRRSRCLAEKMWKTFQMNDFWPEAKMKK